MRNSLVYYGWFVLAASAVSEMLVQGATFYAAPLFVIPLQDEFHISRAVAGSAVSFLIVGALVMAPGIGRLLDTKPVRLIMSAGAVILGLSLTAIAMAHSLLVMAFILLVPMAAAFMCLGSLNTSTLASRWFARNRGLAFGIAAVATSGGSFTVVPLLNIAIRRYGWREALLYEGIVIAAVIIALAVLILRDRPSDLGLENHPENRDPASAPAMPKAGPLRWRAVFAGRAFWIPSLVLAAVSGTGQAIVVTLYPYSIKQLGFAASQATLLIAAFGIAAAITKILAGVLADHVKQRVLLVAAAAFMTVSWLILSLSADYGALLASSAFAGSALGCALPTVGGMIAGSFGANNFGRVMSWTYVLTGLVAILAPYFAGFMYDRSGGYHAAFECFAAVLACLLAMTLLVAPTPATGNS
ncbi:MAG TPA: MFS transporter [Rhizomicrobium sp.]|jgi:MFS family permease|nr:MFS transporter [Rhizomicrobium sp.]